MKRNKKQKKPLQLKIQFHAMFNTTDDRDGGLETKSNQKTKKKTEKQTTYGKSQPETYTHIHANNKTIQLQRQAYERV